jgi:hypothetical protein
MSVEKQMKLVYVSGPYSDKRGTWHVAQNIEKARRIARYLWTLGFAVICPHSNTAHMDCDRMQWQDWIDGDLEMVRRSDTIVMIEGFETSKGAIEELRMAMKYGKEILLAIEWTGGITISDIPEESLAEILTY